MRIAPGSREGNFRTTAALERCVGAAEKGGILVCVSEKVVYLMRGLPSCGKSHKARLLAGAGGFVAETDEYFYTQVGSDPARFDYRAELMPAARQWNFERFTRAVDAGISPIVVDRGNSLSLESQRYARYAADRGYTVELAEPDTWWWQEIRVLLKYRKYTMPVLENWAKRLARMSRSTHRVPLKTILRWMDKWKSDVTVDDILKFKSRETHIRAAPEPPEHA